MAGHRANLAVTKDGETYNKLQRPDNILDELPSADNTTERKRERTAIDRSLSGPTSGNKRVKTQHVDLPTGAFQSQDERRQNRNVGPLGECGMRMTLPIDEEEAQYSDDSLGEALSYLRSVRSEASSIPTLLVASTVHHTDPNISPLPASKTHAGQHTFYQDGAWVSIDESYGTTYDKGDEFSEMDSQEMYYRQLVCRFKILRRRLTRLGARTVVRLDAEASQLSTIRPPSTRHEWLYTIDREYPTPTQVSQLNDKDIKRGLEYCAHAMDRFNTISKQKSCWIWTLLALSGDIGTLDSQKISHIRDLGSRAGEMSTSLRGTPNNESEEVRNQSLRTDPIEDGEYDQPETQADKSTSSGVGADAHDREKGYVQFDTGKRLESVPETALSRALLESRDDMQPLRPGTSSLNDSSGNNRPSDTDNDHATLEQARARLLAQLGDNLVQAGIPASAPDVDQIHQSHSEQIDQGSDGSQQEVQIRAIPSRTEAEMQRQLMRKRDSAPTSTGRSEHVHVLQPSADSYAGDVNTRVAIDMILTVVGECYGQRDLLRYRKPW